MATPELIKEFVMASHFDLEKVKRLLGENPDLLNVKHQWGPTDFEDGIGAGAHVGNQPIVRFFLGQGAPNNICAAATLGDLSAVKSFLESDRALANAKGAHNIPVMFHAAMSGNVEVAELLKAYGCDEGYNHALHGAINHGHTAMVKWLLENGVTNTESPDYQEKTPLQKATEQGKTEIADLLRQHGANV